MELHIVVASLPFWLLAVAAVAIFGACLTSISVAGCSIGSRGKERLLALQSIFMLSIGMRYVR
jgi:hypothetical protein